MSARYNKKLSEAARRSALRVSSTAVILCDDALRVCMKSAGAAKILKHPIIGAGFGKYLDDSFAARISKMRGGWLRGVTYFKSDGSDRIIAEMNVIVYAGELDGERYYAFVSEYGRIFDESAGLPEGINQSLELLIDHIGGCVDELLHSLAGADKLDRGCEHLLRVKRMIAMLLDDRSETNKFRAGRGEGRIAVNILLEELCESCNKLLPAYGYRVIREFDAKELHFCECSPELLSAFFCTLLFNALTVSRDGRLTMKCGRRAASKMMEIELRTSVQWKLGRRSCGLLELAGLLMNEPRQPFVLELMICAEIAARNGWKVCCNASEEELAIYVELPETTGIKTKMIFSAHSAESDFIELLVKSFLAELPDGKQN